MKDKLISFGNNKQARGTAIFYLGTMLVSFGGFLFTIIISRVMNLTEYGILGSLMGVLYLTSIPAYAIDLAVTKIVSEFPEKSRLELSRQLLTYLSKKVLRYSYFAIPLTLLLIVPLQNYLRLSDLWGVALVWITLLLLFVSTPLLATLKGLLRFVPVVINQIFGVIMKIILSTIFVVYLLNTHIGAQLGITLSILFALGLALWQLRPVIQAPYVDFHPHKLSLRSIGLNSLFLSASFTAMFSLDMILVRHYFPGSQAGVYIALSTAGKIIFFAISPIISAFVPYVARKSQNPQSARIDLFFLLTLPLLIGLPILAGFSLFPSQIISLIFSSKYVSDAYLLPKMGIAMLLYSLAASFGNFLLAIGKIKTSLISAAGLLCELILIGIFHARLSEMIQSLIITFGILAFSLFIFSLYATRPVNFQARS